MSFPWDSIEAWKIITTVLVLALVAVVTCYVVIRFGGDRG